MNNGNRDESGKLVLPAHLSKNRVGLILFYQKENYHGEKDGLLFVEWKDTRYYEKFREKFAIPWAKVPQKENTEDVLSRRLWYEFPKAAPEIISRMLLWKGLRLLWGYEEQEYYLTVYVLVLNTYGEILNLMDDIRGPGKKNGVPRTITRQEAERMIAVPASNEFMAGLEMVVKDFFEALDAGKLPKEKTE